MHKLRGSGSTFSTSGKPWEEFRINRKLTARAARLHRLKRKGLTPPSDKHSLRQLAQDAARQHRITKIPMKSTER